MSNREMMLARKSCLQGSTKTIYENIYKAHKAEAGTEEGQHIMYMEIKERLSRFQEFPLERQLRVKRAWGSFAKGGKIAGQFETEWERIRAELAEVGLPVNPLHKLISYMRKVGQNEGEAVRIDRRPRPGKPVGTIIQTPEIG